MGPARSATTNCATTARCFWYWAPAGGSPTSCWRAATPVWRPSNLPLITTTYPSVQRVRLFLTGCTGIIQTTQPLRDSTEGNENERRAPDSGRHRKEAAAQEPAPRLSRGRHHQ